MTELSPIKQDKKLRQQFILKKISKGATRTQIVNELRKKGLTDRQIYNELKEAYESLKVNQKDFIDSLKQVLLERYEELWEKAVADGDKKTALNVLKQMSELFGLSSTKQEIELKDSSFEIKFK